MALDVTGERMTVGKTGGRNEQDHLDRYAFAAQCCADKVVLDVACGTGFGTRMLAEAGAVAVTGVDVDSETIKFAKQSFSHERVTYVCKSATTIPLTDESVDVIVSFETIEHLTPKDCTLYLKELHRVLKSGGKLFISTPNKRITTPWKDVPNNPYHEREFTREQLTATVTAQSFMLNESYGQRMIWIPLTWFLIRKMIRLCEKLMQRQFHFYDFADGRGVRVVPPGWTPRYFVDVYLK